MKPLFVPITLTLLATASGGEPSANDGQFPVESNLRAGVCKTDITPAETDGVVVAGHRRTVHGVRDPLRAGVLLLDDGEAKAAIVTLDVVAAWDEMAKLAREKVEELTGVPALNIMVAASHNHSGPDFQTDSPWARDLITRLGEAAKQAAANMKTVSVGYAEDRIGFSINRRKVIDGRAVVRLNPDGPNDPRVKVLRFDDGRLLTPLAVVMHAVCHPCFFTWGDKGSQPGPSSRRGLQAGPVGATQVGCFVDMAATMTEYHSSSLHDEMPHNNCGDIKRTHRSWATEPVRCSLPSSSGVAAAGISTSDGVDTSPVVTYLRRCPMSSTELVHLMWGRSAPFAGPARASALGREHLEFISILGQGPARVA